jgi:putative transcriptional regulator
MWPFRSPRPVDDISSCGTKLREKGRVRRVWVACGSLAACAMFAAGLMTMREARGANPTTSFLVATPDLIDPIFQRSVILMLPQVEVPLVAGLIINKPTTIAAHKLFPDAPALKKSIDTVYFGGPVDPEVPSLILRAAQPSPKAIRLFDDVYVSTDPASIGELLKDSRRSKGARIFLGRAQWTEDQLHAELLRGSWYIAQANAEMVLSPDPERVWRMLVDRAQLQEVDATGARELDEPALLRFARP